MNDKMGIEDNIRKVQIVVSSSTFDLYQRPNYKIWMNTSQLENNCNGNRYLNMTMYEKNDEIK
jgi:hypothetical protein